VSPGLRAARIALLLLGAASLAAGVSGGLARVGFPLAVPTSAAFHGALMTGGFLGTVISLERAIAYGSPLALFAPLASGLGALCLILGISPLAQWLLVAAPLLLAAASVAIARRQPQAHTVLLVVAAGAWVVGNALFVHGAPPDACAPWWFAFLVLTIAAERLEMTRLMKRRPVAKPLFYGLTALLLGGAALATLRPAPGDAVFGLALVGMALWLAAFDIARRTVRSVGLPRYAAVSLLAGYAWLALGGLAWAATPFASPAPRDAAMHALGLGFVFSMIFAHAPIIVPVVVRVSVRFTRAFYAPLALLHASLAIRLVPGLLDADARRWGALLNAAAIALFVATLLASMARRRTPAAPEAEEAPLHG
jgi:hypothetical protein